MGCTSLLLTWFSLSFQSSVFSLPSPPSNCQTHSMWWTASAWLFCSGLDVYCESVTNLFILPIHLLNHPFLASFLIFHHSSSLFSPNVFFLCYFIFTFGLHDESHSLPFGSKTRYQNLIWVIPGWELGFSPCYMGLPCWRERFPLSKSEIYKHSK